MAVATRPIEPFPLVLEEERIRRRWLIVTLAVCAGLALAVFWWSDLVDDKIGGNVSNALLRNTAEDMTIGGSVVGAFFALVTGLAGTFTACNIAVFGAIAPLAAQRDTVSGKLKEVLKPIAWLTLGAVIIGGLYGAIGALIGHHLPQLSDARIGDPETGLRVRSIQSAVAFGLIGVALIWRGLAALKIVKFPLQPLFDRRPRAELLFMGGLIGAFLIGRPFGLFRRMFEYAADTHNPAIGFATFALQAVGNVLLVGFIFLAITLISRGGFQRWLTARPNRLAKVTAVALIVGGTFFIAYWDIKVGYRAHLIWWPTLPYNN